MSILRQIAKQSSKNSMYQRNDKPNYNLLVFVILLIILKVIYASSD